MAKFLVAALVLGLLACACETTAPRGGSGEKVDGPIEITVGGELKVRGQYQRAD